MSLRTVAAQKSYGLISKKQKAPSTLKKISAFGGDEESDTEDAASNVAKVNQRLRQSAAQQSAAAMTLAALEEDPSVFDYDGSYDTFKAAETTKQHSLSQPAATDAPKSRYIGNLLSTAKVREKEKERVFEKKLLKERKVEDAEFGDKPKFLTAAYKKKLEEDKNWEYEDRLADEIERRTDVRKSGMEGFYKNLLTKNVALGGDVDTHALSAYTAGSSRQSHVINKQEEKAKPSLASGINPTTQGMSGDTGSGKDNDSSSSSSTSNRDVTETAASNKSIVVDSYAARHTAHTNSGSANGPPAITTSEQDAERAERQAKPMTVTAAAAAVTEAAKEAPTESVAGKEAVIMSARDRYLARKRTLETTADGSSSNQLSSTTHKRQAQ